MNLQLDSKSAHEGSAEDLYQKRLAERDCYLEEAFSSAQVTIPSIIPDTQDIRMRTAPVRLAKPFQSLGARGINNLSSKLLLTLFPPTLPFMKYVLSSEAKAEAEEDGTDIAEIESLLARREATIQDEIDIQNIRTKAFLVLRHLLVAGNVLAYSPQDTGGLQVFPLNAYTVVRDGMGNLLDLIYVEKMHRQSITDERVLEILARASENSATNPEGPTSDASEAVLVYTRVLRDGLGYISWQEVAGERVDGSEEEWTLDNLPWLPLRYSVIDGEHYGRGFVEEYRGDLVSYEQLSRDINFASANAAKVVWAINPSSGVRTQQFMDAPNGGAISANPEDIGAIRLDKAGDVQTANQAMPRLQQDLSAAFMLNSSFQRNQERVTAEEIRRMAEELEDTLGGVFSLLSTELQLPLAKLMESGLVKRGTLKALPPTAARIGVVTGLAAIGRGQELQRLREAGALFTEFAPLMPGLPRYLKEDNMALRILTGTGVDTEGLLYSNQEVEANDQAAQEAAQAQNLGNEVSRGVGSAVGKAEPEQLAQAVA